MATTTTLRVTHPVRDRVNKLGHRTRQPANVVIEKALDAYEEALFWRDYAAAATAELPAEELADQHLWDRTLTDRIDG